MRRGLERYSECIPNKEDCQDKCVVALDDPGKYVTVLVGQCNMRCSGQHWMNRIWHNSSALEQTTQNCFLVYHELKAHVQWLVSKPAEAVSIKGFR